MPMPVPARRKEKLAFRGWRRGRDKLSKLSNILNGFPLKINGFHLRINGFPLKINGFPLKINRFP